MRIEITQPGESRVGARIGCLPSGLFLSPQFFHVHAWRSRWERHPSPIKGTVPLAPPMPLHPPPPERGPALLQLPMASVQFRGSSFLHDRHQSIPVARCGRYCGKPQPVAVFRRRGRPRMRVLRRRRLPHTRRRAELFDTESPVGQLRGVLVPYSRRARSGWTRHSWRWAAGGVAVGFAIAACYYLLCGDTLLAVMVACPCLLGGMGYAAFGSGDNSWYDGILARFGKGLLAGCVFGLASMVVLNLLGISWFQRISWQTASGHVARRAGRHGRGQRPLPGPLRLGGQSRRPTLETVIADPSRSHGRPRQGCPIGRSR